MSLLFCISCNVPKQMYRMEKKLWWWETLANSLHKHIWRNKIWQICEILRMKNISEIYSIKYGECLCWGLRSQKLWKQHKMYTFSLNSIVRGYHDYKSLWTNRFDGEEFFCEWEKGSPCDPQAVAMKKEISHVLQVVGHVLDKFCQITQYSSGEVVLSFKCTVTWCQRYSLTHTATRLWQFFILYRRCTLEVLQNRH